MLSTTTMKQDYRIAELELLIESLGISNREFARRVGITPAQITNWKSGQSSMTDLSYNKIKKVFPEFGKLAKKDIPVYEIPAHAGRTSVSHDLPEKPIFMASSIFPEAQFATPVYGDSMYPDFEKGEFIVCKQKTDLSFIRYGECYYIVTKEENFIKRIYPSENMDELEMRSSNQNYPPFVVKKEDILKVYIILGSLSPKAMQNLRISA